MDQADIFQHTALQDPSGEIRLFEFLPTSSSSRIQITLRTYPLEQCPKYSAISYVWGDSTMSRTIYVNGKPLGATENAHYALCQVMGRADPNALHEAYSTLRSERMVLWHDTYRSGILPVLVDRPILSGPLYIWMDSICIDQTSKREKALQVQLMGHIFEGASTTFACVGPHADDSELVIDVFREAMLTIGFGIGRDEVFPNRTALENYLVLRGAQLPSPMDFESAFDVAFIKFSAREYWWRIWIVQEIRLPWAVEILCGHDHLNIRDIGVFTRGTSGQKRFRSLRRSQMYMTLEFSHHLSFSDHSGAYLWDAEDAFISLRGSKCSDFRDRVYGILNLITWGSYQGKLPQIVPDYNITKMGLWTQVANDIPRHYGRTKYNILLSLFRSLPCIMKDPEILELLTQRRHQRQRSIISNDDQALILSHEVEGNQQKAIYWSLQGCQLERFCKSDTLILTTTDRSFADVTRYMDPAELHQLHDLSSDRPSLLSLPDGVEIGWLCAETRPGDYLVFFEDVIKDNVGQLDEVHLIVRQRDSNCSRPCFDIIGPAFLCCTTRKYLGCQSEQAFTLQLDIEDLLVIIALQAHQRRRAMSADDLLQLLSTSVTCEGSTSHAELEEATTSSESENDTETESVIGSEGDDNMVSEIDTGTQTSGNRRR